jgi:hypothetical protein
MTEPAERAEAHNDKRLFSKKPNYLDITKLNFPLISLTAVARFAG